MEKGSSNKTAASAAPWKARPNTGKRPRQEGKPDGPGTKSVVANKKPMGSAFVKSRPSSDGQPASKKPRPGKKITKDDQERLRLERKSSHPQHDIIDKLVRMWNELRERQTLPERKYSLVDEMLSLMKGRVMEVAMRHDTSRAVQGCLKHGNSAQKDAMCSELFGNILSLAKSKHGHQHVQKLLKYGSQEARRKAAGELRGHVARLMTHALGSLVVESGFTSAWSTSTCWSMFQEMYGPEYIHFKVEGVSPRSLTGVLAAYPDKRKKVIESVYFTLSRAVDKNLLSLSVIQRLLCEYLLEAPPEQVVAMVAAVKEQLLSLVASREGAYAATLCLAYGTAKERKLMLRGLKGHMLDVACHLHGHMVLVAALHFTDDTKTSFAAILSELFPHLAYLSCHRHGSKVLLALLAPRNPRYFSAYSQELLKPVSLPAYLAKRKDKADEGEAGNGEGKAKDKGKGSAKGGKAGAAANGEEEEEDAGGEMAAEPAAPPRALPDVPTAEQIADSAPTPTSRKEAGQKRAELLQGLRAPLESVCITRTSLLARSKYGAQVLYEAALCLGTAPTPALVVQTDAVAGKKSGKAPAPPAGPAACVPIMEAIASLVVAEPSAKEIAAQVSEMEREAAGASAGSSQARSGVVMPKSGAAEASEAGSSAASGAGAAAVPTDAMEEDGAVEADEEEEGEDMDEENDDDDDDDDDIEVLPRDGPGGKAQDGDVADDRHEAAGYGAGSVMLPILENSASHLLFKRLLAREAVKASRGDGSEGALLHSRPGGKKGGENGAVQAEAEAPPATPVFGPLLLLRLQGRLADLVDSNRAAFVLVELASSCDTSLAAAVRTELRKAKAALEGSNAAGTPGVKVLLRILNPEAASAPFEATASSTGAGASAAKKSAPAGKAGQQQPAARPVSAGKPTSQPKPKNVQR